MQHSIRLETHPLTSTPERQQILRDVQASKGVLLRRLSCRRVFRIASDRELDRGLLDSVLIDPILETAHWTDDLQTMSNPPSWTIEIQYRPGVTDNTARSTEEALSLLGIDATVATGELWLIEGTATESQIEDMALEFLANALIQRVDIRDWRQSLQWDRFDTVQLPSVQLSPNDELVRVYDHLDSVDAWVGWSQENCWALSLDEIRHLQAYFSTTTVQQSRMEMGLPLGPTDVEVEIIAQSWSEHCKHKIFAAKIKYEEGALADHQTSIGSKTIDSLFQSYIRKATLEVEESRSLTWLRSVFHDNAGVVSFDEAVDLAIKVETHNSPSALDPYGGAMTGILGVNRDILGVGLGAKPIANMDVFCVADPSWPIEGTENLMPVGLKRPRRLLEGVHAGVRDGGNLSGIPTVNGAFFFDQDYAGKPLVFVGTVGVMPKTVPDGRDAIIKEIHVGDRIVMVGGAVGADGIHGATFSSVALDDTAPSTAVQIGDPLTQRRVMDFLLEARDQGLFTCVTDNGAGGLSSSVGEMATLCNGATIDLALAPTKYPNLRPWELMISESQERMTFAVSPNCLDDFLSLAQKRGVVATDLGMFTDSGLLEVFYDGQMVGCLDLEFLHESLPQMLLSARWNGPLERSSWIDVDQRRDPNGMSWADKLMILLSQPNVQSKESWVRQYDHEVQGATVVKPFGGQTQSGPNDSGVLWLHPHGGHQNTTVSVGCGLAPRLSLYDPYIMAQMAVDEAVRNIVATGADIDQACALDNFCWPNPILSEAVPDGDLKLGQLVRCCEGLYDICKAYGLPLVSGKDSMKNDFRGRNGRGEPLSISILPTLLITAMGRGHVEGIQTSAFKQVGDCILRIGLPHVGFIGSEYAEHFRSHQSLPVQIDMETNLRVYRWIRDALMQSWLQSVHDISDGGTLCAVVESCMGNTLSATLTIADDDQTLFAEGAGGFVVSVSPKDLSTVIGSLKYMNIPQLQIGVVTDSGRLEISDVSVSMTELTNAWRREL